MLHIIYVYITPLQLLYLVCLFDQFVGKKYLFIHHTWDRKAAQVKAKFTIGQICLFLEGHHEYICPAIDNR